MRGPKTGGRGEDYVVDFGKRKKSLVGVEPCEAAALGHVYLVADLCASGRLLNDLCGGRCKVVPALFEPVFERSRHGDQLDAGGSAYSIDYGSGAAAAAADQPYPYLIAARGVSTRNGFEMICDRRSHRGGGRSLE